MTSNRFTSLQTLFDHLADAVYLLDPVTSNILWCNRAAYEDLGYEASEILNHSVLSLQKDVVGLPQWSDVAEAIFATDCYTFVGRHKRKDGGEIAVEINTTHFEFEAKKYFLSVARNVNNRLALERDLQARNHSLWFALNEASDGIWEWEIDTQYVFFSPQLKTMLGYGPDELEPKFENWHKNIHPDDLDYAFQALNDHLKGRRRIYDAEYRLKNRNGHYLWVHDRGKVCQRNEKGHPTHVVGMVQNITERKQLQFQLEALAANDVLTQLPNRREGENFAKQQLAFSLRSEQPLCIAVIDMDHFKDVNDLHGHQKGDECLIFAANLLKSKIRQSDFLYRWGGEEFVLILPATSLTQCQTLLDKLHHAFRTAAWETLGIKNLTISIGVAAAPENGHDFDTLINQADARVYQAKAEGRNRTVLPHQTA